MFEATMWVKINIYDKIVAENQKTRDNMEIKEILHRSPSRRSFRKGIHSLLNRADAIEIADIIYRMFDAYR